MIKEDKIDEHIKHHLFSHGKLKPQYKSLISKMELNDYISNRYDDSSSIVETLNRIYYNVEDRPVCKLCGAPVKYYKKNIFGNYCSVKCAMNSIETKEHYKSSIREKYGVDNPFQSPEIKNKIRQTNNARYGVDNPNQSEKIKNKSRNTSFNRYGCNYASQSDEFKNKVKRTCLEKYGVAYALQSDIIKDKSRKTCLKKYGTNYYVQSSNFKQLFDDKSFIKNAKRKEHETRKIKGSYKQSKQEEQFYKLLCDLFDENDIERQFFCERYPFNCDFYIKSKDIFIEYHGSQFHNRRAFNIEIHKDELNELKRKAEEIHRIQDKRNQYDAIIYTWTDLDVRKLEIAKANNLKYLVFYKMPTKEELIEKIEGDRN